MPARRVLLPNPGGSYDLRLLSPPRHQQSPRRGPSSSAMAAPGAAAAFEARLGVRRASPAASAQGGAPATTVTDSLSSDGSRRRISRSPWRTPQRAAARDAATNIEAGDVDDTPPKLEQKQRCANPMCSYLLGQPGTDVMRLRYCCTQCYRMDQTTCGLFDKLHDPWCAGKER